MSEQEWRAEEAPRAKKRVPNWVWWGCGGGCLLLTLMAIGTAALGYFLYRNGTDPEKQWPRLARVLPFDERPANLEIELGISIGADQFHLIDRDKGIKASLIEHPSSIGSDYKRLMDPDSDVLFGLGALVGAQTGKAAVQGREVDVVRFERIRPEPAGEVGMGIRIDLTGATGRPRTLDLRRHGTGPITDEEVAAFLAPFDVWRNH